MREDLIAHLIGVVSPFKHTNIQNYLFTEYVSGGTLGACLRNYGKFEAPMVASFAEQILASLAYSAADEALLDWNRACNLSWSFMMDKVDDSFMKNIGLSEADIWSVEYLVLESLSGRRPFSKEEAAGAIYKLGLSQTPPIPEDLMQSLEPEGHAFLLDCFTIDLDERPTADTLLQALFCHANQGWTFVDSDLYKKIESSFSPSKSARA
ncbi:hypothetical protein BDV96DRAFT_611966 [Lophiotrema nucula]|uniref:mitogen-activated protein kinase n=1 Tax=Lophiotrema nucula TaxID=690887 RepID=A0A6A5ZC32_9PLEO|nr:hypothetical protein BDV96DRAFT_611966 [Lophiotrema nucula]